LCFWYSVIAGKPAPTLRPVLWLKQLFHC
jgi:hypothetical protein